MDNKESPWRLWAQDLSADQRFIITLISVMSSLFLLSILVCVTAVHYATNAKLENGYEEVLEEISPGNKVKLWKKVKEPQP